MPTDGATDGLPEDMMLREGGPEDFSATDPGPPRAPITKWLHARLEQIRQATLAQPPEERGWHAVLSRPVTEKRKQPLKAQRDKLRRTHRALDGWRFRVLTEYDANHDPWNTLWAHYTPPGATEPVPGERVVGPRAGPKPERKLSRLPQPPVPHPQALRQPGQPPKPGSPEAAGLVGMDWAGDDDGMPLREVEE